MQAGTDSLADTNMHSQALACFRHSVGSVLCPWQCARCMQLPEQVHKAKLLAPGKWQGAPKNGVVAVKVQYPDALQTMLQDLGNVRVAANFLQVREAPSQVLVRSWSTLGMGSSM